MSGPQNRGGKENPGGNELARHMYSLFKFNRGSLLFGFVSLSSLSPLVGCGACGVLLLIAIRVWWSISGLEYSYIDCASLWF
ncbi:hypothetical protein GIB67_015972 [Kingdonia uniflora]|uniref:Transmembrane protein n=1 Tax=Kingdonia uniflora TaxID=39325 RepID=A0A7J7PCC5_9MAGN|nr:hypothetical protein GIB67_001961 [Kingdonia uniflora]KAF6177097.1 hypothetical protein GIB67_015972 [Kingdonia uniflora]